MSKSGCFLTTAALLAGVFVTGAAEASSMPTGGRTTQPVGHYEFCRAAPAECRQKSPAADPVELTRPLWARMVEINNEVNIAVQPQTDLQMWGKEEVWSYPGAFGDCEDYVLEKRRRLMKFGVSPGDLLITVVRQTTGAGHAVLTVRTSLGEFILDNLEPEIVTWDQTDYTYLKRQSERNSGVWLTVNDGRSVAVGSVSK